MSRSAKAEQSPQGEKAARTKSQTDIHKDHRARLYQRIDENGLDSLAEHEVLEYLLFLTNARRDTNPIAHALIDRFGTLANVLDATQEELLSVEGVGPAAARLLHLLPEVQRCAARSRLGKQVMLATTEQRFAFLRAEFLGRRQECMLLVGLDERRRLHRKVWLQTGNLSAMELDMFHLAAAAANLGSAEVLIAHNHPNGLAMPSHEDVRSTGEITKALGVLGIRLVDHIIVTERECCSMADTGRMPGYDPHGGALYWF